MGRGQAVRAPFAAPSRGCARGRRRRRPTPDVARRAGTSPSDGTIGAPQRHGDRPVHRRGLLHRRHLRRLVGRARRTDVRVERGHPRLEPGIPAWPSAASASSASPPTSPTATTAAPTALRPSGNLWFVVNRRFQASRLGGTAGGPAGSGRRGPGGGPGGGPVRRRPVRRAGGRAGGAGPGAPSPAGDASAARPCPRERRTRRGPPFPGHHPGSARVVTWPDHAVGSVTSKVASGRSLACHRVGGVGGGGGCKGGRDCRSRSLRRG